MPSVKKEIAWLLPLFNKITLQSVLASYMQYSSIRLHMTLRQRQTKIAADDILIFYFYLSKKIRLDVSCESSARAEDSLETWSLIFSEKQWKTMSVVCCSPACSFKG